jgi:hypothetical protein
MADQHDHEARARRLGETVARVRRLVAPVNSAPATEHERRLAQATEELAAAVEALATLVQDSRTPPDWPKVDEG